MTRLALIHTVGSLDPVFRDLLAEVAPDATVSSTVDEDLLGETIAAGSIPPDTAARFERHVRSALDEGADAVLVTCSSMGPAVDALARDRGLPVLRVDEAMADEAVRHAARIGVLATLTTTLRPTAELIRRRAEAAGRDVEVESVVVDGAFAALKSGDLETHDRLVRGALETLVERVDVVVLAQASMARVAATLPAEVTERTPILSSPRLAAERAAVVLGETRSAGRSAGEGWQASRPSPGSGP
jgi:Asp/Glu/hydantoin racemase